MPETVNPDSWLQEFHNRSYRRHIDCRGAIQLWKYTYCVDKAYRNQAVPIRIDTPEKAIRVEIRAVTELSELLLSHCQNRV